jgi:ribosomal protein S18 acetylase RimI-like enzyme
MNCSSPGPTASLPPRYTRPLLKQDFKDISRIYIATFPSMDDDDFCAAWLNRCEVSSTVLFARDKDKDKDKLIGFGLVTSYTGNAADKKLWFLAVDAAHRSGGSGSFLLKAIMVTSPSLCLAPVNDEKIIAWYQKNGFEIVQRYPFVHTDIPTCLMARVTQSYKSTYATSVISSTTISLPGKAFNTGERLVGVVGPDC